MAVLDADVAANPIARSWELYYRVRSQVETPDNLGKLILFDLVSGDYEIDDQTNLEAVHRLQSRHPDSKLIAMRIGYEAACSFDGGLERLPPL